jgi:phosphatidylserine/phosphatidylglycerophosphate/cardiolipin synthase-like enzyme
VYAPERLREVTGRGLLAAECLLGELVSRQICAHHERRLRRLGWSRAFEPPDGGWAEGEPPPRRGNAIEILVDGGEALPTIAHALRTARSHVHLAGWYFTPDFALVRDGEQVVLRELLAELAERIDVRILVWAGAPLPLFHPSREEVRRMRDELTRGTRIQCRLDSRERPLHCHHEKAIVIDDRLAFVGGIDLTDQSGDRYDVNAHPTRGSRGWHDATTRIEGPAVADVAEHFRMRWHEVTGETLPPVASSRSAGDVELQIVRTIPEKIYDSVPRGDFRILESHIGAFRRAQRFIYVENQFLWSPEIARVLGDKLADPPTDDFRMVFVLPSKPMSGDDDTRGVLAELVEIDDDKGHLLACTIYARAGERADPIYVHAKICIVDDRWLTIGSANLNEHSLFNDTEMNVVAHDPELAVQTRRQLWSEHLELQADELPDDPVQAIDELWRPISEEQHERRLDGKPLTHRLVRLPHVSRRSARLLGPLNGIVVDG